MTPLPLGLVHSQLPRRHSASFKFPVGFPTQSSEYGRSGTPSAVGDWYACRMFVQGSERFGIPPLKVRTSVQSRLQRSDSAFPPKMVYPRIPATEEPAAAFREQGSSRIVYFAGDVGRSFGILENPDLIQLLVNSVHWVMNQRAPPATVEGRGMVDMFAWEAEPEFALHFLNYTNPNMTRPS
jgi:hypothetical protein